jgi:hypothetical protein
MFTWQVMHHSAPTSAKAADRRRRLPREATPRSRNANIITTITGAAAAVIVQPSIEFGQGCADKARRHRGGAHRPSVHDRRLACLCEESSEGEECRCLSNGGTGLGDRRQQQSARSASRAPSSRRSTSIHSPDRGSQVLPPTPRRP